MIAVKKFLLVIFFKLNILYMQMSKNVCHSHKIFERFFEWRDPKVPQYLKKPVQDHVLSGLKYFISSLKAQELSRQQNDFNREVGRLQAENDFLRRNVDPDVLVQWNNNVQQQQPPQQQPQQQNQEQQRQNTQQPPQPPPQH